MDLILAFIVGGILTFLVTTPSRVRKAAKELATPIMKEKFYSWLEQHPEHKAQMLDASVACKIAMNRPMTKVDYSNDIPY